MFRTQAFELGPFSSPLISPLVRQDWSKAYESLFTITERKLVKLAVDHHRTVSVNIRKSRPTRTVLELSRPDSVLNLR